MRKGILILLACTFALNLSSRERTDQDMQTIAMQQLRKQQAGTRGNKSLQLRQLMSTDTYSVYGEIEAEGFVVVSRDDRFLPVLGYATSSFNETDMPEGLRWWLSAIDEALRTHTTRAYTADIEFKPIDNFVKSTWGQSKPYYSLTPKMGTRQCVTGCVSTAMGQILNYYKYPEESTGVGAYTISTDGQINADVHTKYKWDAIRDTYDPNASYTEEESTPVAELLRDCGYASHMNYTQGSSGALASEAALGLSRNFKFNEGYIYYLMRNYYSDQEWMTLVYNELAAKRPILYCGVDAGAESGHAFVFSGVDSEGRIYVNWGWDGEADGYFDIADLGPKGILGRSLSHFNDHQDMILGITPTPENTTLLPKYSEIVMDYAYDMYGSASKHRLSVRIGSFYNLHYKSFNGTVELILIDKDGQQTTFNVYETESSVVYLYGVQLNSKLINLTDVPAGTYTAYLASKSEKDTYYQPLHCAEMGAICYQVTKDEEGNFTVSDPLPLYNTPTPTGIATIKQDQPSDGITRVYMPDGRLVYEAPAATFNLDQTPASGLLIIRNGNTTQKVIK